jgi:uncharacterized protein (DUF1501 family)
MTFCLIIFILDIFPLILSVNIKRNMNRKEFLKKMAAGTLLAPAMLNGFNVSATNHSPFASLLEEGSGETDRVLVLIRLAGGNDGLNTVVPLEFYTNYKNARKKVAIDENKTLKPTGVTKWGLHPALVNFKNLYNDGKLKIIQGVGYPEQDYSHFRSMDIWQTASDSKEIINTGWLGRYLKYEYPNYPNGFPNPTMPDPLAVEINYSLSLSLQGAETGMGITIGNTDDFYKLLQGIQTPAPNTPAGEQLKYIRLIAAQSRAYTDSIKKAYEKVKNITLINPMMKDAKDSPKLVDNELGEKLNIVAQLIAGGLKTRIYVVTLDGFDTHKIQTDSLDSTKGEHDYLLRVLDGAIGSFMTNAKKLGIQDRILGMTFSEFGRRIISNGSGGTDHGAAAPMFVFGNKVIGGTIGNNPTIPTVAKEEDNLIMQYDFRSVYSSVLKDWFCIPETDLKTIFFKNYQALPIVSPAICIPTATHENNQVAGEKILEIYPNPFTEITNIGFRSNGGHTMIQIFNSAGQIVASPINQEMEEGKHQIYWNSENLPAGTYYCRFQNGAISQLTNMLKVR